MAQFLRGYHCLAYRKPHVVQLEGCQFSCTVEFAYDIVDIVCTFHIAYFFWRSIRGIMAFMPSITVR